MPAGYKGLTVRRLGISLGITLGMMVVEAFGGWLFGSIALLSDAWHMLTHGFAIAIGLFGILAARLPVCHHRTFGLLRAEILAAFVNALFLLVVTGWIVAEAISRFLRPQPIQAVQMLAVAVLGLLVNLASMFLLERSRHDDLNVQSVFLHLIGDAASSVAIVVAGVVIFYTGWVWLDPAVSLGIAVLIAVWAWRLLRDSARVLLEMAPPGRDIKEIISAMRQQFPEIAETHNEHVWTITPEVVLFSAHLTVDAEKLRPEELNGWLDAVEEWLRKRFGVSESTLEVKWKTGARYGARQQALVAGDGVMSGGA